MKQKMWVGIKRILGKQAGEADTGKATLRAQNGKMASSSKGKEKYQSSITVSQEHPQPTKRSTQNSRGKSTRGQRRT